MTYTTFLLIDSATEEAKGKGVSRLTRELLHSPDDNQILHRHASSSLQQNLRIPGYGQVGEGDA